MNIIMSLKHLRGQFFPVHMPQFENNLNEDRRPLVLFNFVIIFYILFMLLMQPTWVLSGEMWNEMATNYYSNANAPSYLQKLLSTDAGYIPAPQRLIAIIGNLLNLPATSIPYFYTWSSILFTGMLVGAFCLAQFRKIVKSDFLRLFSSIAILLVADFETRTFLNFTYFATFFVSIITALALVDNSEDTPWWAWFIPVLMVSKPAVLAALPAMILVAFVSQFRFRLIVLVSVVLSFGQLLQLFLSMKAGVMPYRSADISFIFQLLETVKFFLVFFGGFIIRPSTPLEQLHLILISGCILSVCTYLMVFKRSSANALIAVGILLLFFNALLHTLTLPDQWRTSNNWLVRDIPIYRYSIAGFFGCVLVVCGAACSITNNNALNFRFKLIGGTGALFFAAWFLGVGWLTFAGKINKAPSFPHLNSSQWQTMAGAIDAGTSPLCVPINPWWKTSNWMYQRNCRLLKTTPAWEDGSILVNDNLAYQISPPRDLLDKTLVAAAVLVKPLGHAKSFVEVRMLIKLQDGSRRYFSGSRNINAAGLLLLVGENPIPINEIATITLSFNVPVEVALSSQEPAGIPSVAWMGY